MATKIVFMIGSDETGKMTPEYEKKIEKILRKRWKNFTLRKNKGYYEGKVEESIEAVIYVLQLIFQDVDDCINELKVKLVQEKIGIAITTNIDFKLK